jgi:hypothetical protein
MKENACFRVPPFIRMLQENRPGCLHKPFYHGFIRSAFPLDEISFRGPAFFGGIAAVCAVKQSDKVRDICGISL